MRNITYGERGKIGYLRLGHFAYRKYQYVENDEVYDQVKGEDHELRHQGLESSQTLNVEFSGREAASHVIHNWPKCTTQ